MGLLALLPMMLTTPLSGQAQKQVRRKYTVNGSVHDVQSGETLIAANVMELNSRTSAVTDEFGHYSLTLPAGEVRLQFSYVGYQSDTIRLHLSFDMILSASLIENQLLDKVAVVESPSPSDVETATIGAQHISTSEIKRLLAFFGEQDVIKALQLLSGVQSDSEGLSGLSMHGGDPD